MSSRICGVCRTVNTQPAGQQDFVGLAGTGSWAAPAQGEMQTLSALQITPQTRAVTFTNNASHEVCQCYFTTRPICRALQILFSHLE